MAPFSTLEVCSGALSLPNHFGGPSEYHVTPYPALIMAGPLGHSSLRPRNQQHAGGVCIAMRILHSILVHDLLASEVRVQYSCLCQTQNLNVYGKEIVEWNRPFSYFENECGSNDISLQFAEFSNVHNCDRSCNATLSNLVYKFV